MIGAGLGRAPSFVKANALYAIKKLGLAANINIVLDAGDAASYTSGTKWLDISGGGFDFNFGATTAAPTFNGTAGNLSASEYMSFDGGDVFNYDNTTETFIDNMHKDNALFTVYSNVYAPTGNFFGNWFGNRGAAGTGSSFQFRPDNGNTFFLAQKTGPVSVVSVNVTLATIQAAWGALSVAVDEAAPSEIIADPPKFAATATTAYTSPAATAATFTFQIGAAGNSAGPIGAGARIATLMHWSRQLPEPQTRVLHNALRGRFAS